MQDGIKAALKAGAKEGVEAVVEKTAKETFEAGAKSATDLDVPQGIVYKRTNPETGEGYVGQAKSPERFDARQGEHDKNLGAEHDYEILGRAEPGTQLDVLEEDMIRAQGGLQREGGSLANRRHQMSEPRYRANGGLIDDPTSIPSHFRL